MSSKFGKVYKKIKYRLRYVLLCFKNKPKIQLEEYLNFDDTLPSAFLEEFASKEVMGQ